MPFSATQIIDRGVFLSHSLGRVGRYTTRNFPQPTILSQTLSFISAEATICDLKSAQDARGQRCHPYRTITAHFCYLIFKTRKKIKTAINWRNKIKSQLAKTQDIPAFFGNFYFPCPFFLFSF